jgi:hypothetical protein
MEGKGAAPGTAEQQTAIAPTPSMQPAAAKVNMFYLDYNAMTHIFLAPTPSITCHLFPLCLICVQARLLAHLDLGCVLAQCLISNYTSSGGQQSEASKA